MGPNIFNTDRARYQCNVTHSTHSRVELSVT